jgi:Ni,Fe-hydrogenase maturation factor
MKVYVFGNQDFEKDSLAIEVSRKLKGKIVGVEFIMVNPNEDLPFLEKKNVVILDTVQGIESITKITENDLDKVRLEKSVTVHDFDLAFQLKYLKKLGKLKKFTIIGLPQNEEVNYLRIQSILRKLVAQDMQGS